MAPVNEESEEVSVVVWASKEEKPLKNSISVLSGTTMVSPKSSPER
jgi:hypothetical protein